MKPRRPLTIKSSLTLVALLSCLATPWGCNPAREAAREPGLPDHHGPRGFRNPHLPDASRAWEFLRWRLGLGPGERSALPVEAAGPFRPPVKPPDLNGIHHPDPGVIQLTWVGHATFLIQVAGLNILTDPMFSERASPLSFIGPQRTAPPGIPLGDLPRIDAVVVSHNHYDHLDLATVRRLGQAPRFLVPLGLAAWFKNLGLDRVTELDWWQSASLGPLRAVSVPVQHFSLRTPFNHNQSLWCGWVLETPAGNLFFAGDTGYSPDFAAIGARYGPMRLALIPIGGYQPRWFMGPMHVNPPEAIQVHLDVRSRQSVGMHWGTFKLTDEPLEEPPRYLGQALRDAGISPDRFITMKIGETRSFP